MYNAELKNRFVNDVSSSLSYKKLCICVFNSTEAAEEQWNADICTRTTEELTEALNNILGVRTTGHISKINVLRKYFRYCREIGYPGAGNGIDGVTVTNVEQIRRSTVSGPLGLQKYLNKLFDPESEETLSNVFRCYYWFAFAGISERDMFEIEPKDIDLTAGAVFLHGDSYPIYREAYPAIRNVMELTRFRVNHPNYKTPSYRPRLNGNKVMRGSAFRSNSDSVRDTPEALVHFIKGNIYRIYNEKKNKNENLRSLSFSHVALSGLFYRKYGLEDDKNPYTYQDFLDAASDAMYDQHKDTVTVTELKRKRKRIATSLLDDYESWKTAFGL